jgi:hypothetical protein
MGVVKANKGKKPQQSRRKREVQIFQMAASIGMNRKSSVLDLETREKDFNGKVCTLDSIIIKAGRSSIEITILGINKQNQLHLVVSRGKNTVENLFIRANEEEKLWGGMLMDGRTFSVKIRREPLRSNDPNIIASICLDFNISKQSLFGASQSG